jgi:hypothetical protein
VEADASTQPPISVHERRSGGDRRVKARRLSDLRIGQAHT